MILTSTTKSTVVNLSKIKKTSFREYEKQIIETYFHCIHNFKLNKSTRCDAFLKNFVVLDIKVSPKPIDPTASSSIGLITGVAAAGVAIIIVLVIVIIFMRRYIPIKKMLANYHVNLEVN